MKTLTQLLTAIGLLLSAGAFAHDATPQYNRISFSVSAEADIANDQLAIVMTAQEKGHDLQALADKVNKIMAWALEQAGKVDSIKTQTLNYSTQPRYEKGRQTGWQVSQSLSLKSTNTGDISELMGKLQTRMQVQSASYEVTTEKETQLQEQLTTEVLQRFIHKAEKITRALQADQYKIVQINLGANVPGQPRPMVGMARSMMAAESITAPSFEPGTQTISVTATGTIETTN